MTGLSQNPARTGSGTMAGSYQNPSHEPQHRVPDCRFRPRGTCHHRRSAHFAGPGRRPMRAWRRRGWRQRGHPAAAGLPSTGMMLGLSGKPESPDGKNIEPKTRHGLQAISIGLFLGEDTPAIWRGPMTTQYLQQLLTTTLWKDLDYLVIDLPPGTGDIQLTLAQRVPVSAAVIVTTPQDIALLDARRALKMFEKVDVPVLGIVENMAMHTCSNCGHVEHIFGEGGGERMAAQYGVELLGSLPLDISIREQADSGAPTVVSHPDSAIAASYRAIARKVGAKLSLQARKIG